jgi:menaquinone-dependent protoporphyrinogen IX oxidase
MKVAIVFDTSTGTTSAAAEKMADVVRGAGHECSTASVSRAEAGQIARADALVVGAWTKGWFIVRQHPSEGALRFLEKLSLRGQPVAVFTTYRLAVGSTLTQLSRAVEASGGHVTGMYKVKGPNVPDGFDGWVSSLEPPGPASGPAG